MPFVCRDSYHVPDEWRIFIDYSKSDLKRVLYQTILLVLAPELKEAYGAGNTLISLTSTRSSDGKSAVTWDDGLAIMTARWFH